MILINFMHYFPPSLFLSCTHRNTEIQGTARCFFATMEVPVKIFKQTPVLMCSEHYSCCHGNVKTLEILWVAMKQRPSEAHAGPIHSISMQGTLDCRTDLYYSFFQMLKHYQSPSQLHWSYLDVTPLFTHDQLRTQNTRCAQVF